MVVVPSGLLMVCVAVKSCSTAAVGGVGGGERVLIEADRAVAVDGDADVRQRVNGPAGLDVCVQHAVQIALNVLHSAVAQEQGALVGGGVEGGERADQAVKRVEVGDEIGELRRDAARVVGDVELARGNR